MRTLIGRKLWDGDFVWSWNLPSTDPNGIKAWQHKNLGQEIDLLIEAMEVVEREVNRMRGGAAAPG